MLNALGSENARWGGIIKDIEADIAVIIGDVLIASAFISYIGPFSSGMRDKLVNEIFMPEMKNLNIPMSDNPDPVAMLTTEANKAIWNT